MALLGSLESFIVAANGIFWGVPMFLLILGVGLLLTIRLGGIQLLKFPLAVKRLFESIVYQKSDNEGDITPFQALSTALSGTMGIGNIAGVSTAIVLGGPGALFWMWMTAVIGMATKYSEAVLALKFRTKNADGTMSGGPMYYIEKGMKKKWLAVIFAACGAIAAFGVGSMAQANSISLAMASLAGFDMPLIMPVIGEISLISLAVGLLLVLSIGIVIIGGIKRIGQVASLLIPFMTVIYVGAGLLILAINYQSMPSVFSMIIGSAFSPYAVGGGAAGYAVATAIRYGVARGVFTNEAGLGSAPVAYAAAKARSPVDQGLLAMMEVFIDTLFMCSITGFVVLSSGLWDDGLTSTALTIAAFTQAIGVYGTVIVSISTLLFGYSTILGWSYYYEQFVQYLVGTRSRNLYMGIFLFSILLGAILNVGLVWETADLFNGLMAIPNLIALAVLSGIVAAETKKHFKAG
jgi:AGCS family alanine or glycine:cation symporter